jgi:anthranilate 1,2-dioxygenase (deaminating, decarboxylating) large subunit
VFVSLSQFIYQSNQPLILGGKWGLDIIVPIVSLDTDYDQTGPFPEDNGTGIGDILVGPFIQWDPIMGEKGPKFMHRIELQLLLPTGKYDDEKELNPGSNFFSFNPYWAATAFITPELTASLRFHYLWNAVNDDPNRGFGDAEDTQAGQAIHTNMALGYEAIPKRLRVGVNGYYLKQISDTKMNGDDVSGLKEEVFGIGPGLVYHHSQEQHIFANVFFETLAENRTEGTRFTIRYVHHF